MPGRGSVQSPVLVGRDDLLALVERRIVEVAAGSGQVLLVAGEAGIGKTRLLGALARSCERAGFVVARAAAYPGDVQSSGGLLLDLASDLTSSAGAGPADVGRQLSVRLRAIAADRGDRHHRRRLGVQDLVDLLLGLDAATDPADPGDPGRPVLLVLEDLHWADRLSLDVLGHLAARLDGRRCLVAGAYRSDELHPQLPMRELRAGLLARRLGEEIRLPRLDLAQTASMTSAVLGGAAPAQLVQALHQRSDGIPLHVEELLASVEVDVLASAAAIGSVAVPDTLGDAVLSRAGRLAPATRDVASAAAVIGRSFDFDLLVEVTTAEPAAVAQALRELRESSLVLPGHDPVTFDFRHALIRDALYADTDLPARRLLHEQVARTAVARGYRHAFVSAHFEQAGLSDLAHRHALAAAGEAAAMSAHREAMDLYQRAIRHRPAGLSAVAESALFAAAADEAAAVDDNAAAAELFRTAHGLALGAGDVRAAAALVPRMVAVDHLLGAGLTERAATLQTALDALDDVPDADRERARLRSALAAASMLDRRLDDAIAHGERSRAESLRVGDTESVLDSDATLGSVLVFAGRADEGWPLVEGAVARARTDHQEGEAARSLRMLATSASVLVEYDRAERWLTEGIAYAERVELWNHRHYMSAHLAHVQWATGRWDAAVATAHHALADGRGGLTTAITAQYVLGYVAMGRGDWAGATPWLREAYDQGVHMFELQRLSPPLWGLAEAARCQGDDETAIALCEKGFAASSDVRDAAYIFPFLLTGVRSHLHSSDVTAASEWADRVGELVRSRSIPGTLPALEHAHGLLCLAAGEWEPARAALESASRSWRARRRFWEGSWAVLDLATVAARTRRRAEAARLAAEMRGAAAEVGAAPLVREADRLLEALGPQQPSAPWHPLSAREHEVAQLVAAGLTNRQIAAQLVLAPKTVSAHVEHILTKLGAARRAEIATWAATVAPAGD